MKHLKLVLQTLSVLLLIPLFSCGQDESFDAMFKRLTKGDVPVVNDPEQEVPGAILLDAREPNEYKVSHLEGARLVGYDDFELSSLDDLPKDTPIVVYCSVGYRSERVARDLLDAGYTNVSNLYGGIFHWVNSGKEVVNENGQTDAVHAYNKRWGKWLEQGVKVYE